MFILPKYREKSLHINSFHFNYPKMTSAKSELMRAWLDKRTSCKAEKLKNLPIEDENGKIGFHKRTTKEAKSIRKPLAKHFYRVLETGSLLSPIPISVFFHDSVPTSKFQLHSWGLPANGALFPTLTFIPLSFILRPWSLREKWLVHGCYVPFFLLVAKWLEASTDLMRYKHDKNSERSERKKRRWRERGRRLYLVPLVEFIGKGFSLKREGESAKVAERSQLF